VHGRSLGAIWRIGDIQGFRGRTSRCSSRGRNDGFPRVEVAPAGPAAELGRSAATSNQRKGITDMRYLAISLTVLALTASPRILPADDAPKRSEELQVLDSYIGTWDCIVTNKTTAKESNTVEERRWSRKGTFVLFENFDPTTKKESHYLMTYDPNAKAYRTCYIDDSTTISLLGTWDARTKTMTWRGKDGNDNRVSGAERFIDKDNLQWSLVFRNPDGKVVAELSGKQTRRKK